MLARPSAGIGMVEVQKLEFFCDFQSSRANFVRGLAWSRCKSSRFFVGILKFPHDLRESAWSMSKSSRFVVIFKVPARFAGVGVVEVQKFEAFCDFCGACATLCGNRRGRGVKTRSLFTTFIIELVLGYCLVRAPAPGTGGSRVRFLPGLRAGVARCNLHKATYIEQLAQSKLHRANCTEQLAQTNLHRPVCLERFT